MKIEGSCLCKEVAFEVSGEASAFFLCHCSRCRKVTGSAHAANIFFKNGTLKWLSGEESIKVFQLPSNRFIKSFCKTCSSALPTVLANKSIMLPAGGLNSSIDIKPSAHIFCGSRANWDDKLDKVLEYDVLPG